MVHAPKVDMHSNMYRYDKKLCVQELLLGQSVVAPQSGKQDIGVILCHPNDVYDFYLPDAEVQNGNRKFHECWIVGSVAHQPAIETKICNSVDTGRTVLSTGISILEVAAVNKMMGEWASSPTIWSADPLQLSLGVAEAQCISCVNPKENSYSGESSGSLQENTEDLEALMSFEEEEASTGRSPTGFTFNDSRLDVSSDSSLSSSGGTYKRKSSGYQWSEEDEVDLLCQEAESELRENECLQALDTDDLDDLSSMKLKNISSMTLEPVVGRSTLSKRFVLLPSTAFCDSSVAKQPEACSLVSGYSYVRNKPRAEKIKMIVKLLRNIIPGGDSMDTVDVLGEAIQSVRALQSKVSKLEATKRLRIL